MSLAVIQFLFNILNYLKVLLFLKNRSLNYNGDGDTTRYGTVFIKKLIQEIRSHGNVIIENDTKMVLLNAANKVKEELLDNPNTFFTCLYNCINFGQSLCFSDYAAQISIFTNINYIKSLEAANDIEVTKYLQLHNYIYMEGVEESKYYDTKSQIILMNEMLQQNVGFLIELLDNILNLVTQSYLNPWIENQRYVSNGALDMNPIVLDIIQGWYENIAMICLNTHERLKKCMNVPVVIQLENQNHFITLNENVNQLITNLITN